MTSASVLNSMFGHEFSGTASRARQNSKTPESSSWSPSHFGQQQIRALVQQVFRPVNSVAPRQIVFTGVDSTTNIVGVCLQVAKALAAQTQENVCIVEVTPQSLTVENNFVYKPQVSAPQRKGAALKDSALNLGSNLHLLTSDSFLNGEKNLSTSWLRERVGALRRDFDYTIFEAPAAGEFNEALELARLCDGTILALTAHVTRRVSAKKVKEKLDAAGTRILGTVLSDRTFPIPQGIYRRL